MKTIRTVPNADAVVEFSWKELGILANSMIEAELFVPKEDYSSRLGLPFDSADALFWAIKPTVFRFDPRLITDRRPAGSREVDVIVPASDANHGPRIQVSREELLFLRRVVEVVTDKLSAGPVGEAEYFARVGGGTEQGRAVVGELQRLIEAFT